MKVGKNNIITSIKEFFIIILYCFSLSWKSSHLYTAIRISEKIISPFLTIVLSFIGKRIVDLLSGNLPVENKKQLIIQYLLIEIAIGILIVLFQRINEYVQGIHDEILRKDISNKMMDQSLKADLEFFDNSKYYDAFEAVRRDMNSVINVMWNSISCISSVITFLGTFLIVCRINYIYAVLMLLISIPSSIVNKKYTKILYKISLDQINDERKLNYLYSVNTSKNYAADIRLFDIGDMIKQRYLNLWSSMFLKRRSTMKKKSLLISILDIAPYIVRLFIMLNVTFNVINGSGTIGDYVLYTSVLGQLYSGTYSLFSSIIRIYDDRLRIENVKSFEKIQNKLQNNGDKVLNIIEKIEFIHVNFLYPGTEQYVLKNINFTIHKGEKVALVGINGAGKSTVIKLLLRYYDVSGGIIRINGTDIQQYEITSLRKVFSTCFQFPTIYGFNIRENIIIGDYDSYSGDDNRIFHAIEDSDANEIIDKLPNGLDTFITRYLDDSGIELSGGQYQKVALARTFYRNSNFIILDEPSASLDPEAENEIFKKLNKLCENKTVLFTSHRLSNIYIADKIIVIENGEIIEQGTHKQLMANASRYSVLYNYQADKFQNLA